VDHCLLARGIPQVDAFRLKDLRAGVPKVERGVCKDLQSMEGVGRGRGRKRPIPSFFKEMGQEGLA
jgi:hypothetical protein